MAVGVLSNFNMSMNSTVKVAASTEFPAAPQVGELCFKDGVLWIYSQAGGGALTWYPLTNIENTYTHSQTTPTTIWNINHRLNTTDFVYQIFDSTGDTVVANMDIIDADNSSITFGEPVAGTVTLVADADNYGMRSVDLGVMA